VNKTSIDRARALEVILPVALIVLGSFAGVGWLGTVGVILLAIVIARALLRERDGDAFPTLRGLWVALGVLVATGCAMVALLVVEIPATALMAGLAAGMVAAYVALGYIVCGGWSG
jgi:hypothetical protein